MAGEWVVERCKARACGAPITFALTLRGKRMPLDWDRREERPLEVVDQGQRGRVVEADAAPALFADPDARVTVRVLKDHEPAPGAMVWRAHFASCVQAHKFKGPRT